MIRSVLALGLLAIASCVSANATTVHRSRPPVGHLRPSPRVNIPERITVTGWTDKQTRYWLSFPQATG
jgi:hypothetical protein